MELADLFRLIFASFLGLIPVLVLIGRRSRMRRRAPVVAPGAAAEPVRPTEYAVIPASRTDEGRAKTVPVPEPLPTAPIRVPSAKPGLARLGRLTELQRAIVYAEILGKPAALSEPGHQWQG